MLRAHAFTEDAKLGVQNPITLLRNIQSTDQCLGIFLCRA